MHFVGFSLYHTDGQIDPAVLERLRQLWDWRFMQLKQTLGQPSSGNSEEVLSAKAELAQFGWWFAAGVLPAAWALSHLRQVLVLAGRVEMDLVVAEHLAALAGEHPNVHSLAALDFTGGDEPWSIAAWLEHCRPLIEQVLQSEDQALRAETLALVNRIVAAGHLEFRRFLGA